MICRFVQALMDLYLQGRLASFQTLWMKDHIARCPKCLEELNAWQKLFSGLRDLPAPAAPAGLKAALRASLLRRPREVAPPLSFDFSVLLPHPSMAWAFGLAAFLISMSLSRFGPGVLSQSCSDQSLTVCPIDQEKP